MTTEGTSQTRTTGNIRETEKATLLDGQSGQWSIEKYGYDAKGRMIWKEDAAGTEGCMNTTLKIPLTRMWGSARYSAFGETIISEETIPNRLRYNAQAEDELTGLYYLRARYYAPNIGRFIQEDVIYNDGLNLYAYCNSNPVMYSDPSGFAKETCKSKVGGECGSESGKYSVGDATFMDADDTFVSNISRKTDVDANGYFDVIAHGTPNGIQITHNEQHMIVDHKTAARLIQNSDGYNGQAIRLLSCNTGALDNGFAQNLANKLNVEVYAPTNYLWSTPNGNYFVAGMNNLRLPDMNNRETFKLFSPGGN